MQEQKFRESFGVAGLTTKEAERRLHKQGENLLKAGARRQPIKMFASQFKDFLILILLGSTVLSVLMGETAEAIAIIVIVLINAILGFIQEYRTERTMEALRNMAAPTCIALRDGNETELPAAKLVVGDVVLLGAGNRVPADGVLRQAVRLSVDESLLTGESLPVHKLETNEDERIADQSLAFMGTLVTEGRGLMVVTDTGMNTRMGGIADMLEEIDEPETPLQIRLDKLGKSIAMGCLLICAVVAGAGVLRGEDLFSMIVTGISLSVAAVPEGLPAVVTVALSLSVGRMVRRGALIRRLHAVETLGCATVICSDKTGTLTENVMTVREIWTADGEYEASGDGMEQEGGLKRQGRVAVLQREPVLGQLLTAATLCNNASLSPGDRGKFSATGDPTEIALLVMAAKAGVVKEALRGWRRLDELPFDSTRKRMSVLVSAQNRRTVMVKGALDLLLPRCTAIQTAGGKEAIGDIWRRRIEAAGEGMGKRALRVLAFAMKETDGGSLGDQSETGLTFLGFAGMMDPPRKEAYAAVLKCRTAGIRPVMITGDHPATAEAIARQLHILCDDDRVVTGAELDGMSEGKLRRELPKISVFARVTPQHKLRIVRAFKQGGAVVAMTGDGVNDAPAVKEADIGVSMGVSGTDVTKQAADIILLDDNFATLVAAVEEGRVIYDNIRKFIRYLLSCNIGEVLTMFLGMLMGLPVVLLPIQILMVNLATDGLPAIALGLEPPEERVMSEAPRRAGASIFSDGLASLILFRGCLIGLTTLGVYVLMLRTGSTLEAARTGAFLALVLTQLIHVFECKSERKSLFRINIFSNPALVLAALSSAAMMATAIWWPPLQPIFMTTALTLQEALRAAGVCLIAPVLSALLWVSPKTGSAQTRHRGSVSASGRAGTR